MNQSEKSLPISGKSSLWTLWDHFLAAMERGSALGEPHSSLVLGSFHWMGFDLDHTLVRYNVPAVEELIYHSFARYLVEQCGYSTALLSVPFDGTRCSRGLLIDLESGHTLKIDRHNKVIKASFGHQVVPQEDMAKLYPTPVEFEGDHNKRFFSLNTYFESGAGLLWANLIDLMPSKTLDYKKLREDIMGAFMYNFGCYPGGYYFPEIISYPAKYLFKRPEVVRWLQTLRESGMSLFLLTNSNAFYTKLLCDFSLGENWADLFNLVLFLGRKPSFWKNVDDPASFVPFAMNEASGEYEATAERALIDPSQTKFYERGNAHELAAYMRSTLESDEELRACYVGDHIQGDCLDCKM